MIPLQTIIAKKKARQRDEASSNYAIFIVYLYA